MPNLTALGPSQWQDLCAQGVTVLFLLTGTHPFPADGGVEPLAALTQDDVHDALRGSGKVKTKSQLDSFLLQCLSVDVGDRAHSVSMLKASGWISGADKTQFARTSMGKMDAMEAKLDEVHVDMTAGFQDLKSGLSTIISGIEAVQHTIVNLDKSPVPAIFIIEIPPASQKDSLKKQMKRGNDTLKRIFNPRSTKNQVQEAVAGKSLTLRLLCQATGEPVGDGYVIKDP